MKDCGWKFFLFFVCLPVRVASFSTESPPVPSSIASVDPTIAIPERFVDFADDYFMGKGKPQQGRVKNYCWVDQHFSNCSSSTGFSLISWNILAQSLYERSAKNGESPLSWETRLDWILHTLRDANADIICLQEVEDYDVFQEDLLPELQRCGYQGVVQGDETGFVREIKRRKAKGERAHRVATFWRDDLFEAIPILTPTGAECHMARGRTLTSLLQTKHSDAPTAILAVVNCHLEGKRKHN